MPAPRASFSVVIIRLWSRRSLRRLKDPSLWTRTYDAQAGDDKMADQAGHDELKFVLHITDDFAVEEVYDALGAGCVLL